MDLNELCISQSSIRLVESANQNGIPVQPPMITDAKHSNGVLYVLTQSPLSSSVFILTGSHHHHLSSLTASRPAHLANFKDAQLDVSRCHNQLVPIYCLTLDSEKINNKSRYRFHVEAYSLIYEKLPKIQGIGNAGNLQFNLMNLFDEGRYRQISEIIMMKQGGRGTLANSQSQYVFSNLGLVRDLLEHQFQLMKENIVGIYRALMSVDPNILDMKKQAKVVVRAELNKIRGMETIYQALLLRQTLIARQNQFQCKMSVLREQDKEDIEIIEETVYGQVHTNKVILLFLKFALDVDLASLCTNYFDDLRALYKSRGATLQLYDFVAESQGAQDLFQRSQGSFNIS